MATTLTRRRDNQRGQALIETGIVISLLIVVVLGIIEFGWVFFALQMITNAARDGARVAAALQNRGTCGAILDSSSVGPLVRNELTGVVAVDGNSAASCGCAGGVCVTQCVASSGGGAPTCSAVPTTPPCTTFTGTDIPVVKVTVAGHISDVFGLLGTNRYPFCRAMTFRDEGR